MLGMLVCLECLECLKTKLLTQLIDVNSPIDLPVFDHGIPTPSESIVWTLIKAIAWGLSRIRSLNTGMFMETSPPHSKLMTLSSVV